MESQMDTSSEKTNKDSAAQPTAQEKQVPHTAAPAEQAPDEQMGWEVTSRRQRGRDAVEAASPKSQPARKDMRTQQQEGLLTAAAASDKQKQTTPPPAEAQPGSRQQRNAQGINLSSRLRKRMEKNPRREPRQTPPPKARCHLQHRPSPPYRHGQEKRIATRK